MTGDVGDSVWSETQKKWDEQDESMIDERWNEVKSLMKWLLEKKWSRSLPKRK